MKASWRAGAREMESRSERGMGSTSEEMWRVGARRYGGAEAGVVVRRNEGVEGRDKYRNKEAAFDGRHELD
jgi:hypothetical protein